MRVEGAGRTDAGVHALGQVFSFTWPGEADAARLRRAVSSLAGPDAQVTRLEEAPPGFHARYSATGKRYAYVLHLSREPDPLLARYAWTIDARADTEAVADLARRFVGTHDFGGVQGSGAGAATTVRTVHSIELRRGAVIGPCDAADVWRLDFYGTGFLYKMIRNITGALVEVARNKLPEARLDELLAGPGPYRGRTAPGHGLTLLEVAYGEQRKKEALRMGP